MIKQTKITVSGVQIWKKQILTCTADKFAFASTLAVHIYDKKTFQLVKLLTYADKNITALAWCPTEPGVIAQATNDKVLLIWDIETETVKFKTLLDSHAIHCEWSKTDPNLLFLIQSNGAFKIMNLETKKLQKVQLDHIYSRAVVLRCNPTRTDIVSVGFENGQIFFLRLSNQETFLFDAHQDSASLKTDQGSAPGMQILDIAWDPQEDNLLVSFADQGMCLVSFQGFSDATQVVQRFDQQAHAINNIVWMTDRSGNFVTSNEKIGVVQYWNVAGKEPRQTNKIGSKGTNAMILLDSEPNVGPRILTALKNGALSVYNLKRQTTEFQTEMGHFETIFGVEYCRSNKDLLASCSYDGTVRVWNANDMKLMVVNDTNFNSAQAKQAKKIIYSISWHPTETKIAMTTVNGNLMVFEAMKNKQLSHITPYPDNQSFCVDWNKLDPKYILMTSAAGLAIVVEIQDYPACKHLAIAKEYQHPDKVYGCAWNPMQKNEFVTACEDKILRLFDFSIESIMPVKTFEGHTAKIYNVAYSPVLPNIVATGSDDKTIRVWRTDQSSQAISVCGGEGVKSSHTQNVRALCFIPDIPFALLSGSWDATIKMWDIRNGNHLWTLNDHCSDVYGITLHPQRPFVFSTCSRDTSIRTFIIDGFIQSLKINFLSSQNFDESQLAMVDSPENTFATKGTFKLCSERAHELVYKSQNNQFKDELDQMMEFNDFFCMSEGQKDFSNTLKFIAGKPVENDELASDAVIHVAQLAEVSVKKAVRLQNATGMAMANTAYAKKEDRLHEAASNFLRAGQFRQYCEIQFQLENYKKAMAFAPSVSIEYWQELSERYSKIMSEQRSLEAPMACLVSNQIDKAVEHMQEREEFQDAKVVKAMQMAGIFKNVLDKTKSKPGMNQGERPVPKAEEFKEFDFATNDPKLLRMVENESEMYYYQGKTLHAAAAHLSLSNFKKCIQVLVRSQELYLAFYVAKLFYPKALKEVAIKLAERAEKYFQKDLCIRLLREHVKDDKLIELFQSRMTRNRKSAEQFRKDEMLHQQGLKLLAEGNKVDGVHYIVVAARIESAIESAAPLLNKMFKSAYQESDVIEYFQILDTLQHMSIHRIDQPVKELILFHSLHASIYYAIWYGLFDTLEVLCDKLQEMQTIDLVAAELDYPLSKYTSQIISSIKKHAAQFEDRDMKQAMDDRSYVQVSMNFSDQNMKTRYDIFLAGLKSYMQTKTHLFSEPGVYMSMLNGVALQGFKASNFTHELIKGQAFSLEDESTFISQEEALDWACCNRYSPLGRGFRMTPY